MKRAATVALALGAVIGAGLSPATAQVIIGGEGEPDVQVNLSVLERLGPVPTLADMLMADIPASSTRTARPTTGARPEVITFRPYAAEPKKKVVKATAAVAKAAPATEPSADVAALAAAAQAVVASPPKPAAAPKPAAIARSEATPPVPPKPELPEVVAPADAAGPEVSLPETPAPVVAKAEPATLEPTKPAPAAPVTMAKVEPAKSEPTKLVPAKPVEPAKADTAKADTAKVETAKAPEPVPAPAAKVEPAAPVPAAAPAVSAPTPAPQVPAAQVAALPPAAPSAPVLTHGDTMSILFAGEAARLPDASRGALEKLAARLEKDETLGLQLLAYAEGDEASASRARRLSLSRALDVRKFLMEQGVRSTRIEVRALGNKSDGGPADRVDAIVVAR